MEVRYKVDNKFMKSLQEKLDLKNATEVTRNAFALLNCAADEIKEKRIILSVTPDDTNVRQLVAPWAIDILSEKKDVILKWVDTKEK